MCHSALDVQYRISNLVSYLIEGLDIMSSLTLSLIQETYKTLGTSDFCQNMILLAGADLLSFKNPAAYH